MIKKIKFLFNRKERKWRKLDKLMFKMASIETYTEYVNSRIAIREED